MDNPEDIFYSKLDSDRFGLSIYRGTLKKIDIARIKEKIRSNKIDILILRIASELKEQQFLINELGGHVLHADTLVYYAYDLTSHAEAALRNKLDFRVMSGKNSFELNELVPPTFQGYKNHYFSNPEFDRQKIEEGYLQWAQSFSKAGTDKGIGWIVAKENVNAGFITCTLDRETMVADAALFGVHPHHTGQGIFRDMILFVRNYFQKQGFKMLTYSTQVQNYQVQNVLIKERFLMDRAFDTYHINISKGKNDPI